jgi:malonyl-CoA reductase/3-hydroxypropionate dehydrogenase (NADP+)
VNTVFPGPIESERIDTVFSNMDALQGSPAGSTSKEFRDLMITRRETPDGEFDYRYPTPSDVASTITWLASEESASLSGHAFEVTNGMQVPAQSRSKLVSWPDKRLEDLSGQVVLVLGGSEVEEALSFAERHMMSGARVVLAFRSLESLGYARSMSAARGMDSVHLLHLEPLRRESADRCFDYIRDHFGSLDGIVVLPRYGNGQHGYSLSTAGDDDVEAFVRDQIVSPVAFASTLATNLDRWGFLKEAPALTYVTNPSDGHGNLFNDITRAAVEALIRIWRHEDEQMRRKGERDWAILPNQLVRYDNDEGDNLTFSADWAATLTNRVRRMDAINLWVPESIKRLDGQGGHADGDPARPARPAQGQDRGHHRRQPRHRPAAGTLPGDRRCPRAALGRVPRRSCARPRTRSSRSCAASAIRSPRSACTSCRTSTSATRRRCSASSNTPSSSSATWIS